MNSLKVLEEADLEVISMMAKVAFAVTATENDNVFEIEQARRPILTPINGNGIGSQISTNEANFLSEVVKLFGTRVTPTERAELEVEVEKADPILTENQIEVMTQLLVEMGPNIDPETIKEMAHMVEDPTLDIRADNVKDIAQMVQQLAVTLEPQELKTVANMMKKVGPDVSIRYHSYIT